MKHTVIVLLITLIVGCEDLTGPKGDPGPTHPLHNMQVLDNRNLAWDCTPIIYYINFDTDYIWHRTWAYGTIDPGTLLDYLLPYDILLVFDYNHQYQIAIHSGDNEQTEIFQFESASSLYEMTSLPIESQRQDTIIYRQDEDQVYFMIKNGNNRWAKVKLAGQNWEYYSEYGYAWGNCRVVMEWYYYKDKNPDFSLHKGI